MYSATSYSDGNQKKAPGNKLSPATPLPGKNGNPTFAAVAAGYDKSPGKCTWTDCAGPGDSVFCSLECNINVMSVRWLWSG